MSLLASVAPLALVLGLLMAVLWWLRRATARGGGGGRYIQVLETVDLAPGRSLHLVALGGRGLVVASTAQRCELLCELEALPAGKPAAESSWTGVWLARLKKSP